MAQPDVRDADFPLDEAFLEDFGCRWWAVWNAHDPRRVTALCTRTSSGATPPWRRRAAMP